MSRPRPIKYYALIIRHECSVPFVTVRIYKRYESFGDRKFWKHHCDAAGLSLDEATEFIRDLGAKIVEKNEVRAPALHSFNPAHFAHSAPAQEATV